MKTCLVILLGLAFGANCQTLTPRIIISGNDTLGCFTSSQGVLIYNNAIKAKGFDEAMSKMESLEVKLVDIQGRNEVISKAYNSTKSACVDTINKLKEKNKELEDNFYKQKKINKVLKIGIGIAFMAGLLI